jgi:hypothetical protein
VFQVFLWFLIAKRGPLTSVGIIAWSIIFIVKNLIPFVGLLLEHGHNNFINAEPHDLVSKLLKIIIGAIFLILVKYVNFENRDEIQER